jgi:hypothetical protein
MGEEKEVKRWIGILVRVDNALNVLEITRN